MILEPTATAECEMQRQYFTGRACREIRAAKAFVTFAIAFVLLAPAIWVSDQCDASSTAGDSAETLAVDEISNFEIIPTDDEVGCLNDTDIDPFNVVHPPLEELEFLNGSVKSIPGTPGAMVSQVFPGTGGIVLGETPVGYEYRTSLGVIEFSKNEPLTFKLISPSDGHAVCRGALVPEMDTAFSLSDYLVTADESAYSCTSTLTKDGGLSSCVVHLVVNFSAQSGPKFSLRIIPVDAIDASEFRVEWLILPETEWVRINETVVINVYEDPAQSISPLSFCAFEIGNLSVTGEWSLEASVDWLGEQPESFDTGDVDNPSGLQGRGISLRFPRGDLYVDPTIVVGAVTLPDFQPCALHNVFFSDNRIWAFYLSNDQIMYSCSVDSMLWEGPYSTGIIGDIASFDVKSSGNRVLISTIVRNESDDELHIWEGVVDEGTIKCVGEHWVRDVGYAEHPANLGSSAITDDGLLWSSATMWNSDTSQHGVYIDRSYGSSSNDHSDDIWFSTEPYVPGTCILVPKPGSFMTAIVPCRAQDGTMYVLCWEFEPERSTSDWDYGWSARFIDPWMLNLESENDISAVSTPDGIVHVAYADTYGRINYARITGDSVEDMQDFEASAGREPAITVDPMGCLHLFFIQDSAEVMYAHAEPSTTYSSPFWEPITAYEAESSLYYLHTSAACAHEAMVTFYGIGRTTVLLLGTIPIQSMMQNVGRNSDAWNRVGLADNEPYEVMLDGYVSVGNGLLTVRQTDIAIPGRCGMDLEIARVYKSPTAMINGVTFSTGDLLAAPIASGWNFDFPCIGMKYADYLGLYAGPFLHLWGGQEYFITWDGDVFENHNGEHFTLTRTPYGDTPWYTYRLHDKEGVVYDLDTAGRVSKISDPTGHNMITFTYSPDVLIYITDSIGRRATFTYATNGTLSKVAYAGRNTTYVVDHLSNRLLKVIDDLGRTTNYSYDAQGLLTRVTYPSEGFFSVSYDIAWLSTDAYYFPATSIRSYPDSYTRLRAAYFDYELYQGRVVHTEARYYGASDYDYKGKATHSFRTSDSGYLMSLIDSQGNRLRTIHTWYSGSGGVECQDVYSGQNATPSRSIGICDDWGNLIYSKDAVSHERFYTYLYTSTQGSFIAPATFNRVTSGKILYRNFDDRIYSDWTIGSSGVYAIDTEFSPWQAPSLRLTYGTAYAYVAKQIGVSLDADDVFAADVAVSSGSGTDLLQLRTSTGTSLIRIQLASDSSILVSDYSLGYLVWRNQGTFEPGRFYQISIRMTTHSAGGAYYYTASVNGIQTSGTLKSLSGDISQVYCLRSTAGDAWLDNVKVMESPLLNINAEYLHKVTVTSLDGAYLGSFRSVDSARDESLDVSNWLKYLPNVVIAIRDPADTTIGQCFRGDVWGGDWLDFVPRYENSSFKRTTSGFANTNLFSQLYVNNDWPAGSTPIDPWYDVEDPWNDGSDFENASTGSYDYHHSSYWSGLHYHGFTSTTTMPVNADTTYIAQYVYLLPGMLPNQLSVGFTDLTGESRAFWGQDLITGLPGTDEFRVSPTIAAEPGRWSVFCVKAGDIPGLSGSVKGVRYALHGGTARWGMMASGDSAIATLTITGLPVQRVVKLSIAETDGVYVLNSGTSGTVSINLYQTAGISVFPVTASWSVLNIYQNYVESSSPWTKVFGGDVYGYTPSAFGLHYEQDSFDLDEPLSHGLLAGTLDYQTGRANPSSLISRSYMEYCDSDGIASPSKIVQLYNRTWVTTGVLAYSRYGNLLDHTSADGVVTLFSYDSTQTYPIHSTEYGWPNTLTTSYVFNQTNGQLISVTGPGSDAPVTSYEYDIIGRVTEVIYPAVNGRSMHEYIDYQDEYRTVEITRESEALGGTLCYEYDGLGRLVGAADHYSWWYYEYDWQDRLTLAEQYATKRHAFYWTEYDLLGRVTKNAVGEVDTTNLSVTQTVYDDAKRSWKSYDASNHAVGYIADLAGRVTSVREYYSLTSPYYNETTYSYDESGNLVTTMDPLGGVTSYGYDEFGRAISITYPDLKNLRYDLTPSGLPEVVFRRDGWKEKYGYDGHMRLTDKTWTKDASSKHFEYNDEGLLSLARHTASDGSIVTTQRQYDPLGRITQEDSVVRGTTYTLRYEYDLLGRMTNLTYPDASVVRRVFTPGDEISSVGEYVSLVNYDGQRNPYYITSANGVVCQRTYAVNFVKTVSLSSTTAPRTVSYVYAPDGNVNSMTDGSIQYTLAYDGQDRLKGTAGTVSNSYTYDKNGNWLAKTDSTGTTTYINGVMDRIISYTVSGKTYQVGYDSEGNLEYYSYGRKKQVVYSYDWEDELTKVYDYANKVTLSQHWYDAFGRRVDTLEGTTRTITVYSGTDPIYQKIGTSTTECYVYGPQGLLVGCKKGTTKYFYHQDARGDVIQVTDASKNAVWNVHYKPYGEISYIGTQTYSPKHRFTGEMFDSSTGLYNYGFRHYNQTHGRFMSEDPIRSSSNQYTYCGHDPVNMVDRDGLYVETLFDIGSIIWDVKALVRNPTWENLGWLLLDIGCLLLPVPAAGGVARIIKSTDKALDAGRAIDRGRDIHTVAGARGLDNLLGTIGDRTVRVRSTEDIMVFRTYSGHEGSYMDVARRIHGGSWSTIDPRSVSKVDFINHHGAWVHVNPPNFIAVGRINAGDEFIFRAALENPNVVPKLTGGGPDIVNRLSSIDILEWGIPY